MRSVLGKARAALLTSVFRRNVQLTNRVPIVSFCFDDFPSSAYTNGAAILNSQGARGTFYVALALMNTENALGAQFSKSDLEGVLSGGHELGSHTLNHVSCRNLSIAAFESDVTRGREAIQQLTGSSAANFAYPFGHVTSVAKKRIGAAMRSCRGIYGGGNGPSVDCNLLRANSLYGGTEQLPKVEVLLKRHMQEGRWIIFYTHDVRSDPSEFGCTPDLLEKTLSSALRLGYSPEPVDSVLTKHVANANGNSPSINI